MPLEISSRSAAGRIRFAIRWLLPVALSLAVALPAGYLVAGAPFGPHPGAGGSDALAGAAVDGQRPTAVPSSAAADRTESEVGRGVPASTVLVQFDESGLPSGRGWSVTVWISNCTGLASLGTTVSSTAPAPAEFNLTSGSYWYAAAAQGWAYGPATPGGVFAVGTADLTFPTPFVPGPQTNWTFAFVEAGLLPGTRWGVNLSGDLMTATVGPTTGQIIAFNLANGSYSVVFVTPPGYVGGSSIGLDEGGVVACYEAPFYPDFPVNFSERGLPPGTAWEVELDRSPALPGLAQLYNTSANGTIGFSVANGSTSFVIFPPAGYAADPGNGSFPVSGAPVNVTISFSTVPPVLYSVWFNETGLPSGTTWTVEANGVARSGDASSIEFDFPSGDVNWTVAAVAGFSVLPAGGSLELSDAPVVVVEQFRAIPPATYPVEFDERGLPNGTEWSIVLGGSPTSSWGQALRFLEPNGTFGYTVSELDGYTATPSSGAVSVSGQPVVTSIVFSATSTPSPSPATTTASGIPAWEELVGLTAGAAAIAAALAVTVIVLRRRRKGRSGPP